VALNSVELAYLKEPVGNSVCVRFGGAFPFIGGCDRAYEIGCEYTKGAHKLAAGR
jgi:hypothetical protein